jgi:hypothetical protein
MVAGERRGDDHGRDDYRNTFLPRDVQEGAYPAVTAQHREYRSAVEH